MAARTRRNQAKLSKAQWDDLIGAMEEIRKKSAKRPSYQDFVQVHVRAMQGKAMHAWSVHSMRMPDGSLMRGRNFVAWHRRFLLEFEDRLREERQDVTIPYWDWIADRSLPARLRGKQMEKRFGIRRHWDREELPVRADVTGAMKRKKFAAFQGALESIHGAVHLAVGGDPGVDPTIGEMSTQRSPEDPLFWLHHANIDRLWARWEQKNSKPPPNANEKLQPAKLVGIEFGVKVSEMARLKNLGYRYG